MPKAKEKEPGFEESLSSLETIVAQLESGELSLERALELFEEGVALARRCQSQLEDAERKVELLLRERGEIKSIPFDQSKNVPSGNFETSTTSTSPNSSTPRASEKDIEEDDDLDDSIPF